ncbi:MAG: rhodanese-like domain-containing protein [Phaeodactylibacter sp.]|nr:rhodanese-like domain-containing protein [Phaeodactylibacter sp.]
MDITVEELKTKLDNEEDFVFIDVREPHEFNEFNLGARLIPLASLMEALPELMASHKDEEIVVHCRSGNRSGLAKQIMEQVGFSNVRNLLGGVLDWQDKFGRER